MARDGADAIGVADVAVGGVVDIGDAALGVAVERDALARGVGDAAAADGQLIAVEIFEALEAALLTDVQPGAVLGGQHIFLGIV